MRSCLLLLATSLCFAAAATPTTKLESRLPRELCALAMGFEPTELSKVQPTCTVAVLAGGSFLRLEKAFDGSNGVMAVVKGYTGGFTENPTFDDVTRGTTGHAEAVLVVFNSELISFENIVSRFLISHDAHGQNQFRAVGVDNKVHVGTQFRSTVFYLDNEQRTAAESAKRKHESETNATLGTTFDKFSGAFWKENERSSLALLRLRAKIEAETVNVTAVAETAQLPRLPSETQGVGRDDAVAVEASKLDAEGKLFGAVKLRLMRMLRKAQANITSPPPTSRNVTTVEPSKPLEQTARAKPSKPLKDSDAAVEEVIDQNPVVETTSSSAPATQASKADTTEPNTA
jgi:methionine-S-sulfoxide reductase